MMMGELSFGRPENEYIERATNATVSDEDFFRCYPSEGNKEIPLQFTRGTFEDLEYYTGVAFDHDEIDNLLDDKDGILCWGSGIDRYVEKLNLPGGQTMEEKKFIVVVFLFQLMYRLTLSQVDRFNLSAHTRLDV